MLSKSTSSGQALKLRMVAEKDGEIILYLLTFSAIFQEGESDYKSDKTQ